MAKSTQLSLPDYHYLLGGIIDRFSWVEAVLQILLRSEAAVSDAVGRAIFSGVRIEQAMSFCRRIWDATGQEHPPALERAFSQLGLLNSVRNDIVHYGASFSDGDVGLFVSNERIAHTDKSIRRHAIEAGTLRAIFNDLTTVICAIEHHYLKEGAGHFDFSPAMLASLGSEPWQYKLPPQAPPERTPPNRPQAQ